MGLGQLFIGYLFISIFTLAPSYFITDLVGAFLMHEALNKLLPYAKKFKYALYSVYVLFVETTVQCVYYSLKYIGVLSGNTMIENSIEIFRLAAVFVFTITLLLALHELSMSVGDEKLAYTCKRNMWFFVISYFFIITLSLDYEFLEGYVSAFSAFAFLFKLVCAVLVSVNLYSCYMWICLESDHDMDKPTDSKITDFLAKVRSGGSDDVTKEELKKLKGERKNSKK